MKTRSKSRSDKPRGHKLRSELLLFGCAFLACVILFGAIASAAVFLSPRAGEKGSSAVAARDFVNPPDSFTMLIAILNSKTKDPDELMLLRLDAANRRVAVMPVPMELTVGKAGIMQTMTEKLRNSGIRETEASLSALGIPSDFYCVIRSDRLTPLFDLFGTVTYDVPEELQCPLPDGSQTVGIAQGSASVNGILARELICAQPESRYAVQAGLMRAFVRQKLAGYPLEHAEDVFKKAFDLMDTDFSMNDLIERLRTIRTIASQGGDFTVSVVPGLTSPSSGGGERKLDPQTQAAVKRYFTNV